MPEARLPKHTWNNIAKVSGTSLEQLLKEELAHLALSTASTLPSLPQPHQSPSPEQSPLSQTEPPDQGNVSSSPRPSSVGTSDLAAGESSHDEGQPHTSSILTKNLTESTLLPTPPVVTGTTAQPTIDLNPPSIQRVVVEHVVCSSESPSHLSTPGRL